MTSSLRYRAAGISVLIFLTLICVWYLATRTTTTAVKTSPEYAACLPSAPLRQIEGLSDGRISGSS